MPRPFSLIISTRRWLPPRRRHAISHDFCRHYFRHFSHFGHYMLFFSAMPPSAAG
jgi:hypothetical protein